MKLRYICPGLFATVLTSLEYPATSQAENLPQDLKIRSPDPACNPYLTFSVLLAAGLKGIEEGLVPPKPAEGNVYHMTPDQRKKMGIGTLPANLSDAIQLMEKSKLVKEALGEHTFNAFIENKKMEWDKFRTRVTDYELKEYLPII